MQQINITGSLVKNPLTRDWCKLPYPGHKKGCPNWGKSPSCPPKVQLVDKVFDLKREHWFVVEPFDIAAHVDTMFQKHPHWSKRQCRCCLYWQDGVRTKLKAQCLLMIHQGMGDKFTLIPEAMGIEVIYTARLHGVPITRYAFPIIYKIALVGFGVK